MLFFITALLLTTAIRGEEKLCLNNGVIGPVGDKCYHVVTALQDFEDARVVCAMFGTEPISITSGLESNFVLDIAHQRLSGEYWIGLNDLYNKNVWSWMDGKTSNYTNWATGFPKNDSSRNCVVSQINGKWMNVNCSSYYAYTVCQSTPPIENARCMPPSIEGLHGCYIVNIVPETYNDAALICDVFGGSLVQAVNEDELQKLMAIAEEHFYKKDYWIGVSDPYDTGVWQFFDGTPINFTHWATGFPKSDGLSFCVAAHFRDAKWYNDECNVKRVSICQHKYWEGTSNPWIYYHKTDAYYKAFHDANASSKNVHEQRCKALGAHLASIHSFEEHMFIAGLSLHAMNECTNIGIKLVEGKLTWTDGSTFDYQNWIPNNFPAAGHECAHMANINPYFMQWGSYPCDLSDSRLLNYVCKRPRLSL